MMAPPRLVVATRNEHKLRELARDPRRGRARAAARRRRAAARDRRDLRRERAGQGAGGARGHSASRRSPTTPGSPPPALGGRPGRPLGALRRRPDATDEQNLDAADRASSSRPRTAGSPTSARSPTSTTTAPSTSSRAAARATLIREPRGDGGFGYDPAFVPRRHRPRRRAHDGRARAGREARDQPPRPRRAGARPASRSAAATGSGS